MADEECKHPYPTLHLEGTDGGWAECRSCNKAAAFWIDFEEWSDEDPD